MKLLFGRPALLQLRGPMSFGTTTSLQRSTPPPQQFFYPTHIEYIASLDVMGSRIRRRQAGIICTIGPASRDVNTLVKMMESGMNIARLNFSHGTTDYHLETITNIRKASEIFTDKQNTISPVGIALDTKGPEIRTGWLKEGITAEIAIKKDEEVTLTTDPKYLKDVSPSNIYVDYKNMTNIVSPGSIVYIDDGLISLKVLKIEGSRIKCQVEVGGLLGNTKGVNLPGTDIDLPALSAKDKQDITFGVEQKIDIIFASFIRNRQAVEEIKKLTDVNEDKAHNIAVIAKIENQQGMENVDEIIAASDGIMVARGDLGIELPAERIFLAQKTMIAKCNLAGKPIICATQMLESMIKNPRPTRAETSDVANAVLDGADCVMLSGETAKGKFPVECVRVMSKVCKEAEAAVANRQLFLDLSKMVEAPAPVDLSTAIAGVAAAEKALASAIVVITSSGRTAQLVSKFRPMCPIFAITKELAVARKCNLFRGVIPIVHTLKIEDWAKDIEIRTRSGLIAGRSLGLVAQGDRVIVLTGWRAGRGSTNTMKIIKVKEYMLKFN